MKNTKTCPKCGSSDVVEVIGGSRYYNMIPAGLMTTARVDRWVCCSCGYAEEWIDPEKLQKLRENWKTSK